MSDWGEWGGWLKFQAWLWLIGAFALGALVILGLVLLVRC